MERALCINSLEEVSDLVHGRSETIDVSLVTRDICNDPNNKYLQIVPYVTFFTSNPANGNLVFIQYKHASKDSEDPLLSKTSIGFGGYINQEDEITYQNESIAEDTTLHYIMSKQDLDDTCVAAAKRKVIKTLGCDIFTAIGVNLNFNESVFFMGDQNDGVNQVNLGLLFSVKITADQFNMLLTCISINLEEIVLVDKLTVNIHGIVEEMDITITNNKIMHELATKYNVEDWSIRVFNFIVRKEIFTILEDITYDDLYLLSVAKKQAKQIKEMQEIPVNQTTH